MRSADVLWPPGECGTHTMGRGRDAAGLGSSTTDSHCSSQDLVFFSVNISSVAVYPWKWWWFFYDVHQLLSRQFRQTGGLCELSFLKPNSSQDPQWLCFIPIDLVAGILRFAISGVSAFQMPACIIHCASCEGPPTMFLPCALDAALVLCCETPGSPALTLERQTQ